MKFHSIQHGSWNLARLREILFAGSGKKVLVIGDVGVDRYTVGSVNRISPEAPVPVVFVEQEKLKLGLAANVADNIKALNGIPLLVGIVGQDRNADDFRKLLSACSISSGHLVVDHERRTVLKERIVSERQQLLRVDYESPSKINKKTESRILARVRKLIRNVDAVILEDYAKGTLTDKVFSFIFNECRKSKKIVVVDPNARTPVKSYTGAGVLTPNTREAERLSGIEIRDESSLKNAGMSILSSTAARHVVITRGKDGMAVFSAKNPLVRIIPTFAREVYDVSGAGDTVISVLTMALVSGATIEEAAILGNIAAGIEVGKRGTATVSPAEILSAVVQ
ncbi:MAG: D-glycero-beta-D-manno-heptose-7-phosphate kinase [Bdellovibrionota bacterium]